VDNKHLDYLDGWRGVAITFLMIGHFFPVPGINFGIVGVNLFFVLSGYLMGQLLFIKETPLPRFYRRRVSRIVPAHVFFLLSVTLFYFVTGKPINWYETAAALFFVNNYFPGELGNLVMPFGHIWTLSVEEHSYILLSLVAIASRKHLANAKWTIASLTLFFSFVGFWYWSLYSGRELSGKWLHTEVSAYGIFCSAMILLLFVTIKIPRFPSVIYLLLFCIGIMMHWWSVPDPLKTTVGVGIFALTVNLLSNAPQLIKQLLSFKPLRLAGIWSFSIYLWQQPFYVAYHSGIMPAYLAVSLAIGAGVTSFYLIENPIRLYLNKTWGK